MVRHFSADLTLVHAYGPEALAFSELAITDPDLPDEARTHEQQRLRDFALKTFPGQHVETITQLGEAGTVLHGIVQHQSTDLVMLPTHGRGPIRRFLLGSVAAKVLHDIGAAVWTGVGAALIDHAPRMPYESILCALDDSDEAQGVLKAAAAFADNYRAQLWLVQVVQMPPVTMEIDFSPYKKDLIDASEDRLQELKAQLGINALHTVIEGAVADGVRQEAVRRRADLIITGRGHAQAAVGRIWSNVYPIVREAPCPVLSL
jgi:nucleotide-binding universal stress UspA family protein